MNEIIKKIEEAQLKESITDFRVGDTIRVHGKIKEGNRERIQIFEGVVLKRQGGGARETFTVRKTSNGVGVEKTWPLHSPNVEKIEVVRHGKVRRAKLTYLRQRSGKSAKVKEVIRLNRYLRVLHYNKPQSRIVFIVIELMKHDRGSSTPASPVWICCSFLIARRKLEWRNQISSPN